MPKIDPIAVVERARAGGYAVGGFNMHNPESTQALILAAKQAHAPVFLQVGRAVIPHMGLADAFAMTKRELDRHDIEASIHLDHGTEEEVYLAIQLGFDSIMFDGSHLPFEENLQRTKHIVSVAHSFGIPVEAELGKIPDAALSINWEDCYTNPDEAERFVAETGVDLLAISPGVMHGVVAVALKPLAADLIAQIRDRTGVPLVLHGASGVPSSELSEAIAAGVHKLNADTDLRHVFRSGIEDVFAQGDRQFEDAMTEARSRMIVATVGKMKQYGCAGKSLQVRV